MRERCETCALSEVCDGNCTGYEECADVREARAEYEERKADERRDERECDISPLYNHAKNVL